MQFAALDTHILLALAAGDPAAESLIDLLTRASHFPLVTEAVFEQLGELQRAHNSPETQFLAKEASGKIKTWNILDPPNQLVEDGPSDVHADALLNSDILVNANIIAARVIVEASCHQCRILVTARSSLVDASQAKLNVFLLEKHLNPVGVYPFAPS